MQCEFCHHGSEVESICEKLWSVSNAKTRCTAHWKCMVCRQLLDSEIKPAYLQYELFYILLLILVRNFGVV